jgi:prevent-host-death family protein
MSGWQVQDAKARFSEMLARCLSDGPQVVTRRGEPAAVLVSMAEWRRIQSQPRPTLKEWLLAENGPRDIQVPPRGQSRRRETAAATE